MKLEKRSEGAPEQTPPAEEKTGGRKPVLVYIMVLFIVAFLLMALSFVMHQRSNSEALGQLKSSVNALQAVQATQDENLQLQKELKEAQDQADQLQKELDDANAAATSAQSQAEALRALYSLQQQYAQQQYDACKTTIQAMEDGGLAEKLPTDGADGVVSPAQRYGQLREAVDLKLAEQTAASSAAPAA